MIARLQDRAASTLGLDPEKRLPVVRAMLHRPRGDAAGYWLQLLIAAALATLGLALDSTAVVIGAMLIAPLMRPIVELAMGLATGSTPLVFRTGLRAIASIAIVVGAAAGFSKLLPFHEVTGELLARTAPSLLDLFVAAACAVAGAYAVVIASNDVATTAAGTSIGISLVPPLCTAGYGLSIGDWDMAMGAGLLFTANVTGIVIVAGAVFVIVGFGQINIREEEALLDQDDNVGTATKLGRQMSRGRGRLNIVARLMFPLLLLGSVAYPLQKAVRSMSHRSSVRQQVERLLKSSTADRIVQYSIDQASRPMTLRIVIVGDPARARSMEQRLHTELAMVGEAEAAVSVWAVSDAKSVSALSARLDDVPAVLPAPEAPPPPPLAKRVREAWPTAGAGSLIAVWIADATPPRVRATHVGPELGAAGREMLAKAVAVDGVVPVIEDDAIVAIESDPAGLEQWLPRALALLGRSGEIATLNYCITRPPADKRKRDPIGDLARRALDELARATVVIGDGERWRIEPRLDPCPPSAGDARAGEPIEKR